VSTVLVVLSERGSAESISAALRAAGYIVHQCCGPEAYRCPVLEGEHCDFVDGADALVYGLGLQPIGPETDAVLFGMLRWINPTAPLIVVDDQWLGSIPVDELAIRDRLVRVLPSPLVPEEVVSCVTEALGRRRMLGAA
jgi:hypothetical protein